MGRTGRTVGIVLVLSLALVACGGGDDEDAAGPTSSAATAPSTSEVPVPGSTVTTSPTAQTCPPIAARAPLASDETIPVDFDGDGTDDTLRAYVDGGDWHVRGEIGGDGFHDQVVTGVGPGTVKPLFGVRLNPSDATEQAWVKVGSGAYTSILTIFVFQDCELVRPTRDGNPAEFAIGASVRNAVGVTCFMFDQGIEVFEATSDDGVTYSGQSQLYTIDFESHPPLMKPVAGWPMPVPAGSPRTNLACGSLTYP